MNNDQVLLEIFCGLRTQIHGVWLLVLFLRKNLVRTPKAILTRPTASDISTQLCQNNLDSILLVTQNDGSAFKLLLVKPAGLAVVVDSSSERQGKVWEQTKEGVKNRLGLPTSSTSLESLQEAVNPEVGKRVWPVIVYRFKAFPKSPMRRKRSSRSVNSCAACSTRSMFPPNPSTF